MRRFVLMLRVTKSHQFDTNFSVGHGHAFFYSSWYQSEQMCASVLNLTQRINKSLPLRPFTFNCLAFFKRTVWNQALSLILFTELISPAFRWTIDDLMHACDWIRICYRVTMGQFWKKVFFPYAFVNIEPDNANLCFRELVQISDST